MPSLKAGVVEESTPEKTPIIVEESESDEESTSKSSKSKTDRQSESETSSTSLARNETKAVNRSKLVVYGIILLAAAGFGTATYIVTSNHENTNFQNEFANFADDLLHSVAAKVSNQINAMKGFSVSVTSLALAIKTRWPNITVPDFNARAVEVQRLSESELIGFAPLIKLVDEVGWEAYAAQHRAWIRQSLPDNASVKVQEIPKTIYAASNISHNDSDVLVPLWEIEPAPSDASIIMVDLYTLRWFKETLLDATASGREEVSEVADMQFLLDRVLGPTEIQPRSMILQPVFDSFKRGASVVGVVVGTVKWDSYFDNILPSEVHGIIVFVNSSCGADFSINVDGYNATAIGSEDIHDHKYNSLGKITNLNHLEGFAKRDASSAHCEYVLTVYPSDEFHATYVTNTPLFYSLAVVSTFLLTAMIFLFYDMLVQRRQYKVMSAAKRTRAIVNAMFPKEIQERIMEEAENMEKQHKGRWSLAPKARLNEFLSEDDARKRETTSIFGSSPIADLFPNITVMFGDIVGFTAWSSTREPRQVFSLLETIYHEFDEIANRRRVFKVETVGDCYVAAAGLPNPRKDHVVVMARFARDCLHKFIATTKTLEVSLGPDTAELGIRIGLHSGPVTAGVLRGDKARFQLFGDTMNTGARIESTGEKNKIHISQETAELIEQAGKRHWLRPRQDMITAKGKGQLKTFWLVLNGDSARSTSSGSRSDNSSTKQGSSEDGRMQSPNVLVASLDGDKPVNAQDSSAPKPMSSKHARLVTWNSEVLLKSLKEIHVRREAANVTALTNMQLDALEKATLCHDHIVLDEVQDIIALPLFDAEAAKKEQDSITAELGPHVKEQLHDYIQAIAAMYRENPFHNFEHASHVTMSVVKLLARIVAPDIESKSEGYDSKDLHDHTYGITSDPLTQFAVVLAALIHDVDHAGVPNLQLIKEGASIADVYSGKSIAEQNSVDLAWGLLMNDCYRDLRRAIYLTDDEFRRFRQLLVNTVLATDIMDKDLGAARKNRWNLAFSGENTMDADSTAVDINRKATIVIEHLIQASDVAHTMQHWHIYQKWNARLFEEMYVAFCQGRSEKDPSLYWYDGEIGFLDNYVIPLAKKLKSCGVFGVSSDEYLSYAQQNRREWENKGQDIVKEMIRAQRGSVHDSPRQETPGAEYEVQGEGREGPSLG